MEALVVAVLQFILAVVVVAQAQLVKLVDWGVLVVQVLFLL